MRGHGIPLSSTVDWQITMVHDIFCPPGGQYWKEVQPDDIVEDIMDIESEKTVSCKYFSIA
eukprot:8170402-Lingulodinium_polyedra.AAC.1